MVGLRDSTAAAKAVIKDWTAAEAGRPCLKRRSDAGISSRAMSFSKVSHRVAFEMIAFPRNTRPSASRTPTAFCSLPWPFTMMSFTCGSPDQAQPDVPLCTNGTHADSQSWPGVHGLPPAAKHCMSLEHEWLLLVKPLGSQFSSKRSTFSKDCSREKEQAYIGFVLYVAAPLLQALHKQLCNAPDAPARVIDAAVVAVAEHLWQARVPCLSPATTGCKLQIAHLGASRIDDALLVCCVAYVASKWHDMLQDSEEMGCDPGMREATLTMPALIMGVCSASTVLQQ